jgi:lipocalin
MCSNTNLNKHLTVIAASPIAHAEGHCDQKKAHYNVNRESHLITSENKSRQDSLEVLRNIETFSKNAKPLL